MNSVCQFAEGLSRFYPLNIALILPKKAEAIFS